MRCAVPDCKSHTLQKRRYFSLPRDDTRRKEWIKYSKRDPSTFDPTKQYRFCDLHFDDSQYELKRQDNWKKLKPNAIPNVDIPNVVILAPTQQKVPKKTRKRKKKDAPITMDVYVDELDPSTFDPTKQYRFRDRRSGENQNELNRQEKWRKLKPYIIPKANHPPPIDQISKGTRKSKRKRAPVTVGARLDELELLGHELQKTKNKNTQKSRNDRSRSTSETETAYSDYPGETIESRLEDVEEVFIDLEDEDENLPKEGTASDALVSEVNELRTENEKLRKENEQLRTTVVKMQKILARRRFTYLNVKALLQNKNKALIFKNKKS